MRRAPRWARMGAPLASFAASICLYFALDIGPPKPIKLPGGGEITDQPLIAGLPAVVVRSEYPILYPLGLGLLAAGALLWL